MESKVKKALVCGAGGFIGSHLVRRLKKEGYWVRGVDLKHPEYSPTEADEFVIADLRDPVVVTRISQTSDSYDKGFDEIYQLAADMGGAGYIFTGENDANVMHNSAVINLNIASTAIKFREMPKVFYSSSACMYPAYNQEDPENPNCKESSAYPAAPDSEYGWEKLFSERLYLAHSRNYGLKVRIARYHNIFGPEGTWQGGKEKAPAAICRKVAESISGGEIEVWGDGQQTRSFLFVDECVEGTRRLMESDFEGPVNIGSDEMVKIQDLVKMIEGISGKNLVIKNVPGPTGVRGRNSDNELIWEKIGWKPTSKLRDGLEKTYEWVSTKVKERDNH